MLPEPAKCLLESSAGIADLVGLLSRLSGRSTDETVTELREHLASRIFFLLLSDIATASSYTTIERRVSSRLEGTTHDPKRVSTLLAETLGRIEASSVARRSSLGDLPYPTRRSLFDRQNNRCAVCGWSFSTFPLPSHRSSTEAEATLDHIIPFRLGGDRRENLGVLCGLCNSIKNAAIHVGERGRVWIDNFIYGQTRVNYRRSVAFWTLARDKVCRWDSCNNGAFDGQLFAVRRDNTGGWVLDNCVTCCSLHLGEFEALDY